MKLLKIVYFCSSFLAIHELKIFDNELTDLEILAKFNLVQTKTNSNHIPVDTGRINSYVRSIYFLCLRDITEPDTTFTFK